MNTKFSVLFFTKKTKADAAAILTIYMRITINGQRIQVSTQRTIETSKWSSQAGKVKGNTEEARSINSYLDLLRSQVYEHQRQLLQEGKEVNFENLRNRLLKKETRSRMLMEIFTDHNRKVESLLGTEYAPGTLERYRTSLRHTRDFLQWKYKLSDIDVRKVDHAFITEYEFYLRSVRKCNNNSAVKYIKNFGKIIRLCIANGWLDKNPFVNYKARVKEVERAFLTKEELATLADKTFMAERLNQIRDIFLFSCYTGLAYIDVKKLTRQNIGIGIDGEKWILTNRQKTDTRSNIPLLPPAEALLEKYSSHPQCINEGKLLPVPSNQKMNAYLKEIATLCEINKELTFHIARHTFATTVTLSNGVPIESVSKMLGHKNLRTTQHYAKILDRKVSEDMKKLREKLNFKLPVQQSQAL